MPQEGKASDLQSVEGTEGTLHSKPTLAAGDLFLSCLGGTFSVWGTDTGGTVDFQPQKGRAVVPIGSIVGSATPPQSKSRHAGLLASAGSQDKAVTSRGGSLAKIRTISTYGYVGDRSGRASGYICAVPSNNSTKRGRWEWKRGTKLKLTKGKRSVVVVVSDVCNSRYWGRRVDLPREPYLALGGPSKPGLIHDVKVEVLTKGNEQ